MVEKREKTLCKNFSSRVSMVSLYHHFSCSLSGSGTLSSPFSRTMFSKSSQTLTPGFFNMKNLCCVKNNVYIRLPTWHTKVSSCVYTIFWSRFLVLMSVRKVFKPRLKLEMEEKNFSKNFLFLSLEFFSSCCTTHMIWSQCGYAWWIYWFLHLDIVSFELSRYRECERAVINRLCSAQLCVLTH